MKSHIIGLFKDYKEAEDAIKDIRASGFHAGISLVTKENSRYFDELDSDNRGNEKRVEGLGNGSLVGGMIGFAIGSVVAPGLGTLLAAGPLAGLFAGALTGQAVDSAFHLNMTEEKKSFYTDRVKAGYTVVIIENKVNTDTEILEQLRKYHVEDIIIS